MFKGQLKPFDYIIAAVSVLAIVLLSIMIYTGNSSAARLIIDSDEGQYIYPLDKDAEFDIEGPIGHSHIVIKDGKASISDSPCEDKLCVLMGDITKPGHWAACLPNRIFISIEGGSQDEEIDDLSY